ncbi:MAG TPA: hypothetical protein VMV46_15795 [Thermoanaerobaculia bacterium]|nr:hypothetical protein [Thermoanaerobaculia bacterium]
MPIALRRPASVPLLVAALGLLLTWPASAGSLLAQSPANEPTRKTAPPAPSTAEDAESVTTADTVSRPTGDDATAADVEPSAGGLRVFVDPVTGALTNAPRPEQVRALEALERARLASAARADGGERPVRLFALPGGGVGADVTGRFLSSILVRPRPDGSFATVCLDHPEAPFPHDHAPPAAAPPVRER